MPAPGRGNSRGVSVASHPEPLPPAPWLLPTVLVLTLLLASGGAWAWRSLDGRPPRGDEARHLTSATRVARGDWLFPDPALTYPPVGYWVQGTLGGGEPRRAPLAQGVLLAVAAAGLWVAGRSLGGVWTGFLAGLLAMASPLLTVVLRTGYVDMALFAAVAVTLAFLVRSAGFSRPLDSALAGACTGLAALCKFGFPLYLGLPVLLTLLGWPRRQGPWGRGAALYAGSFLLVAAPWYLAAPRIFERMGQFLGGRFYVPSATPPGSTGAFGWVAWMAVDWLWGAPVCLAVLAGLVLATRPGERAAAGLAVCTLVPLATLALLPHRGPHYALPLVACSALLGALPLAHSRWRGWFAALAVVLTLCAAWLPLVLARPQGPPRDVLFDAFCMVCPAGSLAGDTALLLGPPVDLRQRPMRAIIASASRLASPLPPGESALYPVPGSAPGATIALLEPLPPDLEDEALRYEIFRQHAALRVGVVGHGLDLQDADLFLVDSEGMRLGGMVEADRFAFPGGEVRLLLRRR